MLGWELPPHNSGGLGVACYYLSKALAKTGAIIEFVVPYTASHDGIDFMTVRYATSDTPDWRQGLGAYDSGYISDDGDGASIRSLQKQYIEFVEQLIENEQYDVIHAHDWLTMEAGMRAKELSGAPLIVHVHATEFDRAGGNYGNGLVHNIEQEGFLKADKVITVSKLTRQIVIERYRIPAEKVEVVYNALDASSFDDGYEYDQTTYQYLEYLKGEGYTIISAVTRLTIQKGLDYLLDAFALALSKHSKLALLLAGDGEQRDQLIDKAAKLGIADKVFFTGFIRGQRWRDTYSVTDIFVLSSVSEPFGLSALEAAHHQNVLILTKQSGVSEVLQSVLQYDFWDVEELANQMVAVAHRPELVQKLRYGASKEYTRLSWDEMAEKCLNIYRQMKGLGNE
ncbi:MAG TPA: glycosyltransferase family 4 protein [Candidatus Saccharibacteria bacterium]|nr:glycosyltransferase family 4 protein [Candidatus Saccharibacteria bacterium]